MICDRSLPVRECEALVDAEVMRAIPERLGRSRELERIEDFRSAIRGGCDYLRSCGIDAKARTSYLGEDMYITVIVKNA